MVAKRSWTDTGRSWASVPSALVRPTTRPPASPPPASAAQNDAGPMVPAVPGVDPRRATELAHAEDQRLVQQVQAPEIRQETRHARIELLHQSLRAVEIVRMGVPVGERDLHESDSRFDQPPRHEAGAAEGGGAVELPRLVLLPGDVEGFQVGRAHQREGPFVGLVLRIDRGLRRGPRRRPRSGPKGAFRGRPGG